MRYCCRACDYGPCELRAIGGVRPLDTCPEGYDVAPRWDPIPPRRSTMPQPGRDLIPGPFCEIPPRLIVRATVESGRYEIEICTAGRLVLPCSREAFNEAVTAMEAVCRDALV